MKISGQSIAIKPSSRWLSSIPFILALIVLIFLGWSVLQALFYPYDGILSLMSPGLIREIDPSGPAAGNLQVGDDIVWVDGVPVIEAVPFYSGKRGGDVVSFSVDRNGQEIPVTIHLADPSVKEIVERMVPLLVAFIFWFIGIGVQAFKPVDGAAGITFLFFQASAVMLGAGAVSYVGPPWISALFNIFLWFIGPLSVHFHLSFPQNTLLREKRILLYVLYGIATVSAFPYLVLGIQTIRSNSWYSYVLSASELFAALNLLGVVLLLFYAYRHAETPGVRGKIRIVVLGGVVGALPLVALTILPEVLLAKPIIPYAFAFLLLGILPLTYGYAIFRYHLIEIEKHVNRGATYILVYSILGAFYLILYALLHRWLPSDPSQEPFVNTVLVLILASVFVPVSRRIQKIVDTVFYGGWYDYRSAVTLLTQGLEQITDLNTLAATISERLVKTFRLEETCIFLRDYNGDFSVIEVAPRPDLNRNSSRSYPVLPRSSLAFLLTMGETVGRASMRQALAEVTLTPEEYQLLNSEQVHLWVPIIGRGQIHGLLALGPKYGGDIFSSEDLDILRIVAQQIAPVIENIHLLTELRQHAAELEQRVYERTAELHEAKERVEAILASVGDGVIVTDLDGGIITVNTAFEEQSGYPASELLNQKVYELLRKHNDPSILEAMLEALGKGQDWSGELLNQRKNGELYNIQLAMAPVYDQAGKMISYVGSQRDITQQRELDRLKDQFISDVSHELRTPATNLSLYLELLERASPEKRTDYLAILKGQCDLLVKLVEDILDLSRLEMVKARKIELTSVDFNQLTEQVITAHRPLAEASNLRLVYEPDLELPAVRGEENQLARVITNLISNAIRYTFAGEVCVRTFTSNHRVCLEVKDTGIGIDAEDQPHLFERFYRGQRVRQSKIHGTGLGLAIVKEIVDLHEGWVTVQSEVGKGSTFQVWLPVYGQVG
jgi:PAS domain S-box-containing protein